MSDNKIKDTDEMTVLDRTKARRRAELLAAGVHEPMAIAFTIIHGHEIDFGKHFRFTEGPIFIGRGLQNQIVLKDDKISKKHCRINMELQRDPLEIILTDLDSTNGTYLNGAPVREAVLKSGDKVSIGDTVLRMSYDDLIEEQYHSRLFNFAAIDALTGLYNRRFTLNELENQCRIARRNQRQFSIIILDIDNFKAINDQYGHLAGDDYLKKFAHTINRALREQDLCGRVGGEEFLLILPETTIEGAMNLANRIRVQIEQTEILHDNAIIKTTVSAGISQFGIHAWEGRDLFRKADQALQKAKQSGRNNLFLADKE